jgi:hypothetical protein
MLDKDAEQHQNENQQSRRAKQEQSDNLSRGPDRWKRDLQLRREFDQQSNRDTEKEGNCLRKILLVLWERSRQLHNECKDRDHPSYDCEVNQSSPPDPFCSLCVWCVCRRGLSLRGPSSRRVTHPPGPRRSGSGPATSHTRTRYRYLSAVRALRSTLIRSTGAPGTPLSVARTVFVCHGCVSRATALHDECSSTGAPGPVFSSVTHSPGPRRSGSGPATRR